MRFFNTEGPVVAERHYCIPPLSRVNLDETLNLISDMQYFVLHAPSQTGKTSTLLALRDHLNSEGTVRCVYVNLEAGHVARENTARAMRTVLGELASRSRFDLQDDFVGSTMSEYLEEYGPDVALGQTLVRWSQASPLPLVLLVDEIDTLIGHTLISVLRQLRQTTTAARTVSRRAWSCAECGTCATVRSIPAAKGPTSGGTALSMSTQSRCDSAISPEPRCGICWPNTPPSAASRFRTA